MARPSCLPSLLPLLALSACGGDWSSESLPETQGLNALWVFGPEDVWAGGQKLLHFQGNGFEEVPGPSESPFITDFWGLAPNDLYAVGGSHLLHYDGRTWSIVDFGDAISPAGLSAIWGFSKDDLWLGDSLNGQVHHYDGATWRTMITQTVEVTDLWGSSPTDVYAVGIFGVSHWDGSRWSELDANAVRNGDGVFGFSSDDVWIVGGSSTLAHFDGSGWRDFTEELDEAMLNPSHHRVWGSGPSDVWAVGNHGLVSHWDGSEWSQVELGNRPYLAAVHGSGPNQIWLAGSSTDGEYEGLVYRRGP